MVSKMLDYESINPGDGGLRNTTSVLTIEDLKNYSNEMIDCVLELISNCDDADVVFIPEDPQAHDPVAATSEESNMPWTLGHVIVHMTASSEESAALAAESARGVPDRGGRSRSEIPWTSITTIEQCRKRLAESRRMRMGSLEMWPDNPDLNNVAKIKRIDEPVNAFDQFLLGLIHEHSHLKQIEDIIFQSKSMYSGIVEHRSQKALRAVSDRVEVTVR